MPGFSVPRCCLAVLALAVASVAGANYDYIWKKGRASFYGTDDWSIHKGSCAYGYIWPDEPHGEGRNLPARTPDARRPCPMLTRLLTTLALPRRTLRLGCWCHNRRASRLRRKLRVSVVAPTRSPIGAGFRDATSNLPCCCASVFATFTSINSTRIIRS